MFDKNYTNLIRAIVAILFCFGIAQAQSTEFTYQGRLLFGGAPANGNHDFEFRLFSDAEGQSQVGSKIPLNAVSVNNGVFSVRLDFGDQFPGAPRYLEIGVRQTGQEFFTVLSPLQAITSAPYAIKSLNAENAANANNAVNAAQLEGINANQFVLITDPRLTDAREALPNSPNYIQNSTTQQASSSFNVSGDGVIGGTLTAGALNGNGSGLTNLNAGNILTGTISDARLSTNVATLSGAQIFTGNKTFSGGIGGSGAGLTSLNAANITFGTLDSARLGVVPVNKGGTGLTVPGTSGNFLRSNGTSWFSSPLAATDIPSGSTSYVQNTTAQQVNTNFNISGGGTVGGTLSGNIVNASTQFNIGGQRVLKTDGNFNLFAGLLSGTNTTGGSNSFFGLSAGASNTSGSFNSYFGRSANGSAAITNATALGALARVTQSNSLVLGSIQNVNGATANTNVGIGTTSPDGSFEVVTTNERPVYISQYGSLSGPTLFGRYSPGTESSPSPVTVNDRLFTIGADGDTGTGFKDSPSAIIQFSATENWSDQARGTQIYFWTTRNGTTMQSVAMVIDHNGNVGIGDLNPKARLTVEGAGAYNALGAARFDLLNIIANKGFLQHVTDDGSWQLATTGGATRLLVDSSGRLAIFSLATNATTSLCRNSSNQIGDCTFSSIRFKTNINPLPTGLNLIRRLRPVSFNWKEDNTLDLGLIAEEVAEVEPLLANRNDKGEIEGVKYDRIGVVLINAVQEQQQQIESQQKQIDYQKRQNQALEKQVEEQKETVRRQQEKLDRQQAEIEALMKFVCSQNPRAVFCQPKN